MASSKIIEMQNYVQIGMRVKTIDTNQTPVYYTVQSVNLRSNARNFVGIRESDGSTWRVPYDSVVKDTPKPKPNTSKQIINSKPDVVVSNNSNVSDISSISIIKKPISKLILKKKINLPDISSDNISSGDLYIDIDNTIDAKGNITINSKNNGSVFPANKYLSTKINDKILVHIRDKCCKLLEKKWINALPEILSEYNNNIFSGNLEYLLTKHPLKFEQSNGSSTIGLHIHNNNNNDDSDIIKLSINYIQSIFTNSHSEAVNGLVCHTASYATLLVFEHELVHYICAHGYPAQIDSAGRRQVHGKLFKTLVLNLFNHTDHIHNLGSGIMENTTDYIAKVKKHLYPGTIIQIKTQSGIKSYKYISHQNRSNVRRFRASDLTGMVYLIPFVDVILPTK